jgi:hypothetical protein
MLHEYQHILRFQILSIRYTQLPNIIVHSFNTMNVFVSTIQTAVYDTVVTATLG